MSIEAVVEFIGGSMHGQKAARYLDQVPTIIHIPRCVMHYKHGQTTQLSAGSEWNEEYIVNLVHSRYIATCKD